MSVEILGTNISVDLECTDCGHEWQETFYEDHVFNACDREFQCPKCEDIDDHNS
mgnify:CR=1 FL=1